jgi:hypothetical protein
LREKRSHDRFAIELELVLLYGGERHPGRTRDVSLGGMFVHTAAPLRFGTEVEVELSIARLRYEGVLPAVVRWQIKDGIGLAFRSLRPRDVRAFHQLFKLPAPAV